MLFAFPAAPAIAHRQNGNPDPGNPGNPASGRHDVIASKVVSVRNSRPDPCSANVGPPCRTASDQTNAGDGTTDSSRTITSPGFFQSSDVGRRITGTNVVAGATITGFIDANSVTVSDPTSGSTATASFTLHSDNVDVSATSFNGTGGSGLIIRVCNVQSITPRDQGGEGGVDGQVGCNMNNSITSVLDSTGNVFGPVSLSPPSSEALSDLRIGPTSVCPPTTSQINGGWTCVISVAQTDGAHEGYRTFNMKSPIPSKLCNGGACGATIPPGTTVRLTGVRFPCRTIRPDDPAVLGNQGSCLVSHPKSVLVKRVATGEIESRIAATSGYSSTVGDYGISFPMPDLAFDGELYKLVVHAPACPFNQGSAGYAGSSSWLVKACESGNFNAEGVAVRQ